MAHFSRSSERVESRGLHGGGRRGQGWPSPSVLLCRGLGTRAHTQLCFVTVTRPRSQALLVAERPPPADKWSLVQLPLGNLEARTVDDSVSLKHAHMPCFQASVFSVSLLAFSPMKREKKEKHSQAPSSLPVCFLDRKCGNQIPVFWQPHVPPDSPLTALALKLMRSPFPVPVLHLPRTR